MKLAAILCGLALTAALQAAPFRLDPGDNRYIQFNVTRIPTLIECRYRVLKGDSPVHLEILSDSEYRRFARRREYESLLILPEQSSGELRRLFDERGRFDAMLVNTGTSPVLVDMEVRTDVDPPFDAQAQTVPPQKRLTVILSSFAVFLAVVFWAGAKLLRAKNLRF
jgi:hypothetical protein